MPANNFSKERKTKGLIFIHFIYLQGRSVVIQALALGDFTVNMGQGLIQWQSLAFKKSVDVMGVKRQSRFCDLIIQPVNLILIVARVLQSGKEILKQQFLVLSES